MDDITIYKKLMLLPDNLKKEADDFVEYLLHKAEHKKIKTKREAGLAKGLIKMKENFDDPIDDFSEYTTP